MNTDNLHELINRYEENYCMINDTEHDEKLKWRAVRQFQKTWFSENSKNLPFPEMFKQAVSKCSVLLNTSIMHPTTGIVKMAEVYPDEVEKLFRDVLFAPYDSIDELQNHMDEFIDKIEEIRKKHFPRCYSYNQDKHGVSVYLSFFAPQTHYIYRYSDAEEFAKYLEYGKDLGSGGSFSLKNYYELADIAVKALKEHTTLMKKYDKLFKDNDEFYYDPSLHIMAYDLMYCCRCYNFYSGLTHADKKQAIKSYTAKQLKEKEEAKRQETINKLENQIHEIDVQMTPLREISLLNVEVEQKTYGTGTIIEQNEEKITVQFETKEVKFIINKGHSARPHFENDEEIVEAFAKLIELKEKRRKLVRKLSQI